MLSMLLTQVGNVLSKLFVFASFVPVLVFAFLNATLLYLWHPSFREWASGQLTTTTAFYAIAAIVGIAVIAYVMTMLKDALRLVLEGRTWLPQCVLKDMRTRELKRRKKLQDEYELARKQFLDITILRNEDRRLRDARVVGRTKTVNTYTRSSPAANELRILYEKRMSDTEIKADDAERAIDAFVGALESNKKFLKGATDELDQDDRQLLVELDHSIRYWKARELRAFNQRQFEFGTLTPEPTRMGNVAQSLQAYALARYHLNLESLWSGFFAALKSEKDMITAIEDTKAQLDFLVACVWLSILSTLLWQVALVAFGGSWLALLALTIIGPALAYIFYRFAVQSYGVFADVVRASLDQHRFCILDAMNLPVPTSLRDERAMWDALQELVVSGGKFLELSYRKRDKHGGEP